MKPIPFIIAGDNTDSVPRWKKCYEKQKEWNAINIMSVRRIKSESKKKNRDKNNISTRRRYHKRIASDPRYKMKTVIKNRFTSIVTRYLKRGLSISNKESVKNLIGCSWEDFCSHIEKQFKPGMSWENHGKISKESKTWNIDHIVPCAAFDMTDPAQQSKCFHFTNLQPLWALENMIKSNKYEA